MFDIYIDKEIAQEFGVDAAYVRAELAKVPEGENARLVISSPGGSVYEGVAIFNVIREYSRNHPVQVYIQSLAASMASYIALAAKCANRNNKVLVESNAVYMIHNVWGITIGDYRIHEKNGKWIERLTVLLAKAYSDVTGKSLEDVRKLMDDETFFVGEEVVEAGFADEVVKYEGDSGEERGVLVAKARLAFEGAMSKLDAKREAKGFASVAASLPDFVNLAACSVVADNKRGDEMSVEDLKAKYPDEYAAILAMGEKAGAAKERARVNEHLEMGAMSNALDIAAKNIKEGKLVSDEGVYKGYLEAGLKSKTAAARKADSVEPVPVPEAKGESEKVIADLAKRFGVKE